MLLRRLDRYVTFAVVGAYAAALVFLGAMFVFGIGSKIPHVMTR